MADLGLIPGLERTDEEGHGNPLQYSCLENSRQRSLVGYTPWGCKEADKTERPIHIILVAMIIDERARVSVGGPVRKVLTLHRQEEGLWKGER